MASADTPTTAEAKAIGIPNAHSWPYGPNVDHHARRELVTWATYHRLRYTQQRPCLHWLRTGRCPKHPQPCLGVGGWRDHITGWTRNKQPAVLVAQAYHLIGDDLAELVQIDQSGLAVRIDGTGWYGNGTIFITIWRAEPDHSPAAAG